MKANSYRSNLAKARTLAKGVYYEAPPAIATLCRTDFALFREYVCGHETYPHHVQWERELNTGVTNNNLKGVAGENTLILAPRGSTKSTFLLEWVAWLIGVHTAPLVRIPIKILYISYTVDVAILKSIQIKEIIASDKFRQVFPWCLPGKNWANKLWAIDFAKAGLPAASEPYTLACSGIKGAVASRRANLVVMDDLIKSPEQIENLDIREKMERNWTSVIRPTMYEGARAVCLGTRMRADDIYATTFVPDRGWIQKVQESILVNPITGLEKSYWEEGQSLEFLKFLREDDPVAFSFQYNNKIVRVGTQSIHPDWIVKGQIPDIQQFEMIAMGVDLSASRRETADYTVMVMVGKLDDYYYPIDMRAMRSIGNIEKLEAIVDLWEDWGCPRLEIWAEANAYQKSFSGDFIDYVVNGKSIYDITCNPVHSKEDKLVGLRGITGLFQNRRIVFNRYADFGRLTSELINWGSTPHDDCVDALVLALKGLRSRRKLEIG